MDLPLPITLHTEQQLRRFVRIVIEEIGVADVISYEALATELGTSRKTIGQMVKRSNIEPVQMGRTKGIHAKDKSRLR